MSYSFGPSNTSLREWVRERFVPVIMVVASHSVETVCKEKNGLSFVDLLRPFGEQNEINAALRIAGTNIRVTQSRLRFSYAHTMEQPTAEAIDAHLRQVVEKIFETTPAELGDQKSQDGLPQSPWFLKYRQDFLRLLCFDVHETFDHPLGCIYAIASSEVDSLKAFEDLIEASTQPSLMLQEYMVPIQNEDCAKLFVIVHDGSKEGQTGLEIAKEKVRLVQKEYGHDQCVLLLINTSGGKAELRGTPPVAFDAGRSCEIVGGAGEHTENVIPPKEGFGCYLSKADLDRINELVRNFTTRCFFPKLDTRIGRLRSCVSYKRRGFAGRLVDRTSSLLKTSFSGIGREHGSSIGFKHYTDEAQMRHLGDIFFLLGRYEDALEVFTVISVSKDVYSKFYAGIQLMIALSHVMLVGYADPAGHFSKAYDSYLATPGKTCRMFATRAAMLHSAYHSAEGNNAQAAQVLLKGYDTEEILRGALLLEQSAILQRSCRPSLYRKFAFHMTLAGVWFYNCSFHRLSLRCYHLVLDVYTNRHWARIEQHVAAMMLKFHLEQGNKTDAFSWTLNMLTTQHELAPELQREYMQWIASYVEESPSHNISSIADFSLPIIHLDTIHVQYDGEIVYATSQATETDSVVWQDLESRFKDPFSASTTTGIVLSTNDLVEPHDFVACGEPVCLACLFENPLQTPIEVTSAQLLFEFERTDNSGSPKSTPVSIPERRFVLKELEKVVLQMELIPRVPGRLRIIGLSWYLNGIIPGHTFFDRVSWEEEGSRLPFRARAHHPKLLFVALEPVPRLQLTSVPVPARLWRGELWRSRWAIESVGKIGLKNVQITTSTPDLTLTVAETTPNGNDALFYKQGVYHIDAENSKTLNLELCFSPQTTGSMDVHTVIRYESPQSETPLRVRFVRYSFTVEIIEPLKIVSQLLPSEIPNAFVMAMDMENRLDDAEFTVHSVRAETRRYLIRSVASDGDSFSVRIPPRKKLLQHVFVHKTDDVKDHPSSLPNGKVMTSDGVTSEPATDAQGQLIDTTKLPLIIAMEWTSTERSSEISVSEKDDDTTHVQSLLDRQGRLSFQHDLSTLSAKVQLTVDSCQLQQKISHGPARFPVNICLKNVSVDSVSLAFSAGEECTDSKNVSWKQRAQMDTDDEENNALSAGLSPLRQWSWNGQTEKNIARLEPSKTVKISAEIICFFPGAFCVVDYCCKWRSCDNPVQSGTVSGQPLYVSVTHDVDSVQPSTQQQ